MERFFLIFSVIGLWGCQLPSMIPADKYIEPHPVESQETPIIYESVWQRIDDKSSFKKGLTISFTSFGLSLGLIGFGYFRRKKDE